MVGTLAVIVIFLIVVWALCSNDTPKTHTPRRNAGYSGGSTSYCPSCGASGYDGYCEECGYPDVNLAWVGENY